MSSASVSARSVKSVRNTFALCVAALALEFAGHQRHRMAERIQQLADVAVLAERASRVRFSAGIEQHGALADNHDVAANVVVVMVLCVMAALERDAHPAGRVGRGPRE